LFCVSTTLPVRDRDLGGWDRGRTRAGRDLLAGIDRTLPSALTWNARACRSRVLAEVAGHLIAVDLGAVGLDDGDVAFGHQRILVLQYSKASRAVTVWLVFSIFNPVPVITTRRRV